jgi:hypothetical protein
VEKVFRTVASIAAEEARARQLRAVRYSSQKMKTSWRQWGPRVGEVWQRYPALAGHGRIVAAGVAGAVLAAGGAWMYMRSRRPTAEELERRRRELLATQGRMTDGVIEDARSLDGEESISETPEVLLYSYELSGVTYHCAQDVSRLPERVRGYRLDQPVSVRYDPRHPGNSVIVAESWSGLWLDGNLRRSA